VYSLRNAAAHFNIEPRMECRADGKTDVAGFRFWDRSGFDTYLTVAHIDTLVRRIAKAIAGKYSPRRNPTA
jgi:hypothetical protein